MDQHCREAGHAPRYLYQCSGREGMPLVHWASLPWNQLPAHPLRNGAAKSSSWDAVKDEGGKNLNMFFFQLIEPTVVKTSCLICMTRSVLSTLIDW